MCGIFGVVHLDGEPVDPDRDGPVLREAGRRLTHRGPDEETVLLWRNVGFVFCRLSIVDVEGGRQPMENENGDLVLMVNGEIYNHRELRAALTHEHAFATRSDSEILLHL